MTHGLYVGIILTQYLEATKQKRASKASTSCTCLKVLHIVIQKNAKSVGKAEYEEVIEETTEQDDPSPATIWWFWCILHTML